MLTWWDGLGIVLRRPGVLWRRIRIIASNGHFRRERERWLNRLTGPPVEDVRRYVSEVEQDAKFLNAVRSIYRRYTAYLPLPTDFMTEASGNSMFFHCVSLYALVRLVRPEVVVETGGTPGKSSAFILRAMQRNQVGQLYTVDLPPQQMPYNEFLPPYAMFGRSPAGLGLGWVVPPWLKERHKLVLGDARQVLPQLLEKIGTIDVFIHDSDHSYEHMRWEFETAWPFVRNGGYLWSDDINSNTAWQDFCDMVGLGRHDLTSQGAARKP